MLDRDEIVYNSLCQKLVVYDTFIREVKLLKNNVDRLISSLNSEYARIERDIDNHLKNNMGVVDE